MLFPIKHENMTARRWPLITLGLILVNFAIFLSTHQAMEDQEDPLLSAKAHVLVLAAQHPELAVPPEAQQLVTDFRRYYPTKWEELESPDDKAGDDADTQKESADDEGELQKEMDDFATEYSKLKAASITERYAFIPARPKLVAYFSAMFLHEGWLHLIGNMWFYGWRDLFWKMFGAVPCIWPSTSWRVLRGRNFMPGRILGASVRRLGRRGLWRV